MSQVAIVGCGVIGASWALNFARAGHAVRMYDTSSKALEQARDYQMRAVEVLTQGADPLLAGAIFSRIQASGTLEEAVANADWVQESVKEDLAVKRAIFAALDTASPSSAMLASSTSEIPVSEFASELGGRARCFVAHPLNPPHLIPLVEICPAPFTDAAVIQRARSFLTESGSKPIVLQREIPGFIANRLQVAVIVESLRLVSEGLASAADVDTAMKHGLGLRWALMGPFETNRLAASGGYGKFLAEYWPTLHSIAKSLDMSYQIPAAIGDRIEAELSTGGTPDLALATAERDRGLIALRRLIATLDTKGS